MNIRILGDGEAHLLANFDCVMMPRDWEAVTDEMVRQRLPELMESGQAAVAGGFDDEGTLDAIAAWAPSSDRADTWVSLVLGVRLGRQRHHLGREMKQFMIDRARDAGIRFIRSVVHRDNATMLGVNNRLELRVLVHPDDPYNVWMLCIIEIE